MTIRFASLVAISSLLLAAPSFAQEDSPVFTVGDIRVEGLQRVTEGTVYNYLPINIGDTLSQQRLREAVRALYETGFFRDVEMRRDGNTLIVVVNERPTIESFEIKGNKDIKTEDLNKSLRNVGLAQGKTFDRSVLEDVKSFLTDQYGARGKYAARIDTNVEEVAGNRVKIKIDIVEGKRAKIRQINIVGNKTFKEKDILDTFELKTPNLLSFYKQDDRYSRESLQGDLEKLRSFYMDRGYANFEVESTQVAIAPEKDDIFITVNVNEGEVFKVKEVKLAGTFVIPEALLKRYLLVRPGDQFSRKVITSTQELLQNRLGEDGFAFAKVDPVPTTYGDPANKELSLTFFIDPGNRVYVRHINFNGVTKINDEVLRREMRQLEGGWLSNVALERSKQRLERLPYIKKVESETKPVAGSADLVDVNYDIEEGPSAQLGGGIGYSESQSFILSANYADANFLGTGRRVAIDLNSGRYSKVYGLSVTEPYFTADGVGFTGSLSYRDQTQFVSASSDFSSETLGAGFDIGYPISENQGVRFGLSFQKSNLLVTGGSSARQSIEWVRNNGDHTDRCLAGNGVEVDCENPSLPIYLAVFETQYDAVEFTTTWNYDSRNRSLFADRGMRHSLGLSYAIPGLSDVEYYVASYEFLKYIPLFGRFTLQLGAEAAYGFDIGDTTAVPPYRQFYAGGPETVRGYKESRLGPKDDYGRPFGGNMKVAARAEVIIPLPQKFQTSARLSWFYDMGNVFQTGHRYTFYGPRGAFGPPVSYDFEYDKLKHSTGLAVQWLAPLGVFRFSYAIPLNAYKGDANTYADEVERFQFSVGQAF
ncbi:MAG TPA: outer membrane protein assembly factor BamA [Steroidobacteraceae bacterium]|nr:outer membrane protein assembly factor BamA [Steroidobacteraceae bacterium]